MQSTVEGVRPQTIMPRDMNYSLFNPGVNQEKNNNETPEQNMSGAAKAQTELEERKFYTDFKIQHGFWMRGDFAMFITHNFWRHENDQPKIYINKAITPSIDKIKHNPAIDQNVYCPLVEPY